MQEPLAQSTCWNSIFFCKSCEVADVLIFLCHNTKDRIDTEQYWSPHNCIVNQQYAPRSTPNCCCWYLLLVLYTLNKISSKLKTLSKQSITCTLSAIWSQFEGDTLLCLLLFFPPNVWCTATVLRRVYSKKLPANKAFNVMVMGASKKVEFL